MHRLLCFSCRSICSSCFGSGPNDIRSLPPFWWFLSESWHSVSHSSNKYLFYLMKLTAFVACRKDYLIWMKFLSWFYYGFELLMINQWDGLTLGGFPSSQSSIWFWHLTVYWFASDNCNAATDRCINNTSGSAGLCKGEDVLKFFGLEVVSWHGAPGGAYCLTFSVLYICRVTLREILVYCLHSSLVLVCWHWSSCSLGWEDTRARLQESQVTVEF